ncbi:MAG: hypothetical protein ACR2MP_07265 [Streptosporangiaceae bacterium]
MWRVVLSIAGALIAIAGVVWTLQGLGYIRGSVMTGVTLWALIGPLIALCGLAATVTGLRRLTSRPPPFPGGTPRFSHPWNAGAA